MTAAYLFGFAVGVATAMVVQHLRRQAIRVDRIVAEALDPVPSHVRLVRGGQQ